MVRRSTARVLVLTLVALLVPAAADSSPRRCRVRPEGCAPPVIAYGVPERCRGEAFVARVRVHLQWPRRMTVLLDRRPVSFRRDTHAEIRVACAKLAPGRHRLEVVVRDGRGHAHRWAGGFDVVRR